MSRVLLIEPGCGDYYRGVSVGVAVTRSPPLNLALLAAVLERAGHQVRIWDLQLGSMPDSQAAMRAWTPDLVGISFRTPQLAAARRLATAAKRACPGALLVAGGTHASAMPEDTVDSGSFDIAVRGEGEAPLAALADGAPRAGIPGLSWQGGSSPAPAARPSLDELPSPAWQHFDLAAYRRRSLVAAVTPVADLETSRGCRAACLYCSKSVFGREFRTRSPERVVDDAQHARRHGFRAFNLVDDSFATDLPRAVAVCEALIRRDLRMPWTCTNGLRVCNLDETFFRLAQRAGCRLVAFGLESGSDRLLRGVGKGATTAQARRAVQGARRAGITTVGYFMLGLPGETERSLRATLRFSASLGLDYAKFSLTMPLPGTALYERWRPHMRSPLSHGFSIHRPARDWFEHPELPWSQLEACRRRAYLRFYGRPRWLARRLLEALPRWLPHKRAGPL